jgi:integrase
VVRVTTHCAENALSDDEFHDLVDAAYELDEPFDVECAFVLYAAGRLGLRAGELAHIDESWVNWKRSIIEIPAHDPCDEGEDGGVCGYCHKAAEQAVNYSDELTMDEALAQRWQPKTDNSARAIPFDFDDDIKAVVEAFFDLYDGYDSSRASVNRRVDRVLEAAGYPQDYCYPHALRATAATWHAYRGVDAVPLQALFGWADLATAQKYIRLSGGATQDALRSAHADD